MNEKHLFPRTRLVLVLKKTWFYWCARNSESVELRSISIETISFFAFHTVLLIAAIIALWDWYRAVPYLADSRQPAQTNDSTPLARSPINDNASIPAPILFDALSTSRALQCHFSPSYLMPYLILLRAVLLRIASGFFYMSFFSLWCSSRW